MMRRTFTAHWIICLVCAGGFAFAWHYGAPQLIWANDQSYMTSVIAALFVATAAWVGWQAWIAGDQRFWLNRKASDAAASDFGHLAALLAPALGMLGTAIGLSMQAKALAGGSTSFLALATSLYSTGTGVAAFILINVIVFNLEAGIKKAGR